MAVPMKYRRIVGAAAKAAGAIGVPGAFSFGLDVAVMGTIWAAMIFAVAERSSHRIKPPNATAADFEGQSTSFAASGPMQTMSPYQPLIDQENRGRHRDQTAVKPRLKLIMRTMLRSSSILTGSAIGNGRSPPGLRTNQLHTSRTDGLAPLRVMRSHPHTHATGR